MNRTIEAMISWVPREKGGRREPPVGPTYMTVAHFEGDTTWPREAWTLVVKPRKLLRGGHYMVADVAFLADQAPSHLLRRGNRFQLFEGPRLVATGIVRPRRSSAPCRAAEFQEALLV